MVSSQHNLPSRAAFEPSGEPTWWFDRRTRGRLRFDGRDAASFLHALVTNDVTGLGPGQGIYAAYLTPQGRMIADLRIYRFDDHLLADVPEGTAHDLAERFDGLVFSEDVRVTDVSSAVSQLAVIGHDAVSVLAAVTDLAPEILASLPVGAHVQAGSVVVARIDDADRSGFDLFVPAAEFDAVSGRLAAAGARQGSAALWDALRIDAGRPAFGIDMTTETIPLEAGLLDRAISTTKGCYVGQEVIIRVLHRGGGRVAKRLARLDLDAPAAGQPAPGDPILVDGGEVGRLTSVARSPRDGRLIALGYVQRDVAEPGRMVTVRSADAETGGRIVRIG